MYEPAKTAVISIAFEDMFLCSDYAAFESCFSLNKAAYAGGGRTYAASTHTAVALREDTEFVPFNYGKNNYPERQFLQDLPWLPKKLGRRWMVFDTKYENVTFGTEYGRLSLGLAPIIGFLAEREVVTVRTVGSFGVEPLHGTTFYEDVHPTNYRLTTKFYVNEHPCFYGCSFESHFHIWDGDISLREECACCGNDVDSDDMFGVGYGEDRVCEDCYTTYFIECKECGEMTHDDDIVVSVYDEHYCSSCANSSLSACYGCDELYPNKEVDTVDHPDANNEYYCRDCAVNEYDSLVEQAEEREEANAE